MMGMMVVVVVVRGLPGCCSGEFKEVYGNSSARATLLEILLETLNSHCNV